MYTHPKRDKSRRHPDRGRSPESTSSRHTYPGTTSETRMDPQASEEGADSDGVQDEQTAGCTLETAGCTLEEWQRRRQIERYGSSHISHQQAVASPHMHWRRQGGTMKPTRQNKGEGTTETVESMRANIVRLQEQLRNREIEAVTEQQASERTQSQRGTTLNQRSKSTEALQPRGLRKGEVNPSQESVRNTVRTLKGDQEARPST
jgi:hypothetical protein